jgi:photosystem II stability/assembly factor-like uncharacterized protein
MKLGNAAPMLLLAALTSGTVWTGVDQWTNAGPQGGCCEFLIADPQNAATFYAGTGTGWFKTTDSGASWNNTGVTGLSNPVFDPKNSTTLYALESGNDGSDATRLFKSTDGGATWNDIFWLPPGSSMLTIDPQHTGTLYALAGSPLRMLLKTADGGANWTVLPPLPGSAYFMDLKIDPRGTLYAAAMGTNAAHYPVVTVFKSTDGATNWNDSRAGLPAITPDSHNGDYLPPGALTIDPSNPSTIYLGRTLSGVYKSTDAGASWRAANLGMATTNDFRSCCISGVAVDPQNSNTLYALSINSVIYKSSNGGLSWLQVSSGAWPFNGGPRTLVVDPQNTSTIYGLLGAGVFRSTDAGATWNPYFQPRALPITSLLMDPVDTRTIYAGRFKSADAGGSWVFLGAGAVALAIDPQSPWVLYGGKDISDGEGCLGISKSVDGGGGWVDTRSRTGCVFAIVIDPQNLSTLYAGSSSGVFKSTDAGVTWSDVNAGLSSNGSFGPDVTALAIDPKSGTLYTAVAGKLFKSTDGAGSWSDIGLTASVNALAFDPHNSSVIYAATAGGLLQSTDVGATWQTLFTPSSSNVYAVAINPQNTNTIYIGTDSGVAQSTDGGTSWSSIPGSPDRIRVLALDPQDPTTVYAGGLRGFFTISLSSQGS